VHLSVALAAQAVPLGGAVGIVITVQNRSNRWLCFGSEYPDPHYIQIDPVDPIGVERRKDPFKHGFTNQSSPIIDLPPGSTARFVVYLNRHFVFRQPGTTAFRYTLKLPLMQRDIGDDFYPLAEKPEQSGTLQVVITQPRNSSLLSQIRALEKGLSSTTGLEAQQSHEALKFLDTPLAVPALLAIVEWPWPGNEDIYAVARWWQESAAAARFVRSELANSGGDKGRPRFVDAILRAYFDQNTLVDSKDFDRILSSKEPRVREVGLHHLQRLTTVGLTGALYQSLSSRLLNDPDVEIARFARDVLEMQQKGKRARGAPPLSETKEIFPVSNP
jgi:hypothetical protein